MAKGVSMTEQQSPQSGFFQMSLATLQRIARLDGGYNDMAAYLVLCSGVNGRQADRYCTHGANSISKRSGMSHRAAEKALAWLQINGFIRKPAEHEPQFLGTRQSQSTTVRWVIMDLNDLDVAICRQFIDGHEGPRKRSPLKRLLEEIDNAGAIPRARAVMDSIVLFAALMKEQDFGDCGGVDPTAWHQKFVPIDPDEDGYGTEHKVPVPATNGVLVTVKEDQDSAILDFVFKAFGENPTDDNQRKQLAARFWHAGSALRTADADAHGR